MKDATVEILFKTILGYMKSFDEIKTLGEQLQRIDTLEDLLLLTGELAACHERAARALRDLRKLQPELSPSIPPQSK